MFELKCLKFLRSLWTIADGYDDLIFLDRDGPHRFRITAMGFHPYAIRGRLILCEIVRSVVFPIIVAFLTTLITLAIAK